jgi:tetratricopeptide (TPR) repeat protein
VCADPADPQLLDTLASLIDKSLVTIAEQATAAPRFSLLETIRQHAAEQLEAAGQTAALRERHLAHFSALGREAQPFLCGPGQREWSARLDPERPNLRVAMATALEHGHRGVALQLVWDTVVYYYVRDAFEEPRRWLAAIAAAPQELSAVQQAHLEVALAIAGTFDDATSHLEAAVRVYEEHGVVFERAVAQHYLGMARWRTGDVRAAIGELEAASAGYRSIDHDWGVAMVETTLGAVLAATGARDTAIHHHERSLSRARLIDNQPLVVQTLQQLALATALDGDLGAARGHLREALQIVTEQRSVTSASYCLEAVAALALRGGDTAGCVRALAAAHAARERLGVPGWTAAEHAARQLVDEARDALGAPAFEALWAEGAELEPYGLLRADAVAPR